MESGQQIAITEIRPNPEQPRRYFDESSLAELAESIRQHGVLQPLIIRRLEAAEPQNQLPGTPGNTPYILVAGERRWRASKLAGLDRVPAIVCESRSQAQVMEVALIENIQRENLRPVEEAKAISRLILQCGLTQDECAQRLGKSRASVTNSLRLLSLPDDVQSDIETGNLTPGHGRALLTLPTPSDMRAARDVMLKRGHNVRRAEQLCRSWTKKAGNPRGSSPDPDIAYLAEQLRSKLRTRVRVTGTPNRGAIEVSYFSAPELERILATLGVGTPDPQA